MEKPFKKSKAQKALQKSSLERKLTIYQKSYKESNYYPLKVVNHILDQELPQSLELEAVETKNYNTEQRIQLLVPHPGKQVHQLLSKMKKQLTGTLLDGLNTTITHKSMKFKTMLVRQKMHYREKPKTKKVKIRAVIYRNIPVKMVT